MTPLPPHSSHKIPYDTLDDILQKKHSHTGFQIDSQEDAQWLRQLAQQINVSPQIAINLLQNWSSVSTAQKDKVLRFLLAFYVVAAKRLFL